MIITKVCSVQEVVVFVPVADLAQLLLKDKFNPNAKYDCSIRMPDENMSPEVRGVGPGILLVQVDRTEREPEVAPPSSFDPEWEKWNQG